MTTTIELLPGVTLRCHPDTRFKQGCLSFSVIRPMCAEEAALNALIPAVLLRGTKKYPDLRAITLKLDDLYGASIGTQVRRVGDYQTMGLYCGFLEDRFALPGDRILAPMVEFLREVLLEPVQENGVFVIPVLVSSDPVADNEGINGRFDLNEAHLVLTDENGTVIYDEVLIVED